MVISRLSEVGQKPLACARRSLRLENIESEKPEKPDKNSFPHHLSSGLLCRNVPLIY